MIQPLRRPAGPLRVEAQKAAPVAEVKNSLRPDWDALLTCVSREAPTAEYPGGRVIFMQGEPADALFFVRGGKVRLAVASQGGKEAIVATLGAGEFFGEGCMAGQPLRMATATSEGGCELTKVEKSTMTRLLHDEPAVANAFIGQLLSRIVRYEADFVDQMFNSSEKRLARILLLLSHFKKESKTETVVAGVNQEHLAQMVGTTRSRVNLFMNKFRKLGFINYNAEAGLIVHRGLLSVLHD
jgi:CRP/FNR family cyclic AMP-dependent transcriptional regulator